MKNISINKYIVTKVLGYIPIEKEGTSFHNGDPFIETHYFRNGLPIQDGILSGMLPFYSSDLKQSIRLLERLRKEKIIGYYEIHSPCYEHKTYNVIIDPSVGRSVNLPKAICLAVINFHKENVRDTKQKRA